MKVFTIFLFFGLGLCLCQANECFDYGIDYAGFDMKPGQFTSQKSAEECQIKCQDTAGCQFWTWDPGRFL